MEQSNIKIVSDISLTNINSNSTDLGDISIKIACEEQKSEFISNILPNHGT
jgi:hypothetical protein